MALPTMTEEQRAAALEKARIAREKRAALKADIKAGKKSLVVLPDTENTVVASLRNIEGVKVALANTLNVYDILNCDSFIIAKGAVEKLEEVYA